MMFKWLLGHLLLIFACLSNIAADSFVGINIGPDRSSLPSVERVVAILRDQQITHVRIFDSDSHFLSELSNTGIEVMIGVTNEEVSELGKSPSAAASWVNTHVSAFTPATDITAVAVGSEVPSSALDVAPFLVSAMDNIYKALVASHLNNKVKVSSPLSMDMIPKPFPPSTATFNASLNSTIYEILGFLEKTNSFYMLNAYPYDTYVQSNGVFPLEYALFQPIPVVKQIVDPNTLFHYESMLDAMVDAAYYSIAALNNTSVIPIIVTETGWPWSGGGNENDATVEHAETFNTNLVRRVLSGSGPPSQPSILMNSYIYQMFIDDKKPSYGVFFSNGSAVYNLDVGDAKGNSSSGFCVARKGADPGSLQDGLNWACGQGGANCTAIQSGNPCYLPNTLQNHASYAYNDYYQRRRDTGGTCDFGGTAITTNVDPSYGSCIFTGSSSNSSDGRFSPPAIGPGGPTGSASPPQWIPEIGYLMLAKFSTWLLLDVQMFMHVGLYS